VLDSFAVIAFFEDDPGAALVEQVLREIISRKVTSKAMVSGVMALRAHRKISHSGFCARHSAMTCPAMSAAPESAAFS
jgi:hypothetical protein